MSTEIAWHEPHPVEFRSLGKIPRFYREAVVTEKIDGTNAAIGIHRYQFGVHADGAVPFNAILAIDATGNSDCPAYEYLVYAQSRSRIIAPGADNHGFARWVWDNAPSLVADLGEGLHFGEWFGQGVNRGYGLTEKRLALFNTKRWEGAEFETPCLGVVPVLRRGKFSERLVSDALLGLCLEGSRAVPGYMRPEGVVVYHVAGNVMFKSTIENDEEPKSLSVLRRREAMELAALWLSRSWLSAM